MKKYNKEAQTPFINSYKSIFMAAGFIFFGSLLIIWLLAPGSLFSSAQMSPDYLFCYIFIFLIRYPKEVPLISILFLSLLADFLWYRPIGLNTLVTLLTSEFIRWIITLRQNIGLLEEFTYISLLLLFGTITTEIIKFFTLIPSLALSQIINYISFTLMLYFAMTLVMVIISKLRK